MLITDKVLVKWNGNNKKWYMSKGYPFTKYNDEFEVKVCDLPNVSHVNIQILCDYCFENNQETLVTKEWRRYVRDNLNSVVKKDCCASCQQIKTKECNMINFGVESKTELETTRRKMKDTMLKNFGVEYNMQNEEILNKAKSTFIQNYGFDNPMKNKSIIEKSNKTKIDRFGSTNPFIDEKVLNKAKETNLRKYGTEWQMQNKNVMKKSKETMYRNGTAPCSRQQKYIHNLLGGELNYPVGNCSLDIAFPEEKIYIEYDGNGHDLSVKLGNITRYKFDRKEIRRYLFLKSKGWKQIRIISPVDYLPNDEIILEEIEKAKEWLNSNEKGHSHYIIEIGNKINDENFGLVRRIKDDDLNEVI
jgi:very-short-patch-repair endonuclease